MSFCSLFCRRMRPVDIYANAVAPLAAELGAAVFVDPDAEKLSVRWEGGQDIYAVQARLPKSNLGVVVELQQTMAVAI